MISKCATVILDKRKFSEFEDGDIDEKSLYVVGYQEVDGERRNVKVSVQDLIGRTRGEAAFVVDELDKECPRPVHGDPDGIFFITCGGLECFVFDVSKTGGYIQINAIKDYDWNVRTDSEGQREHYINIAFTGGALGQPVMLYLPNFGPAESYRDVDGPCRVYLYQVGPYEMEQISQRTTCTMCDFAAGQRKSLVLSSYPLETETEEGKMKREYYDYFTRFITLTNRQGVKLTRVVEVANIYDGDFKSGEDPV